MEFSRIKFTGLFCIISLVVSYSSFIVRLVCFSSQNFLSFNVCEKFDFCFTDFSNCMSLRDPDCTNFDRRCRVCGNLLGKKTLTKEKYITQRNSILSINITKDLQYYMLPRYAWNAAFLWIRPPREIYSTIFHLKHMKTGAPMITIRTVSAKLNKEALRKVKKTSKNDRRGCPSLLKFGQ